MHRQSSSFRAGILAAVLAATLQFVFLAGSLSGVFSPAGAPAIDHSGQCGDTPGGHRHNDGVCALCPVCLALTLPGVLPPPDAGVPPPREHAAARPGPLVPPSLVPARVPEAAYPRGPPLI